MNSTGEKISELLVQLQKSNLVAECPNCQREFKLAKAILFDGNNEFPVNAKERENEMLEGLDELKQEIKEREEELKNSLINTPKRSERITIRSNLGTSMQNFLPYNKDLSKTFQW